MSGQLAISELYERLVQRIPVSWIAGRAAGDNRLDANKAKSGGAALAGHLNLIHSNQIQLIGPLEMAYLEGLSKAEQRKAVETIFAGQTDILVLTNGVEPLEGMADLCNQTPVALMVSSLRSYEVLSEIQFLLAQELADQVTLHGVFLEVAGLGLLLTGGPGTGKSELALELVTRGHRLVADDAPVFSRISPTILSGACPEILQDFLEVRGLGVLNVRAMFGDNAIKSQKYLGMIVNLAPLEEVIDGSENRLEGTAVEREILGIRVPEVTLPIAPGRDVAILVEAAARNQLLKSKGYDSAKDFQLRLRRQIAEDSV